MTRGGRRKIPRILIVVVPAVVIGATAFFLSMAWRSNRETRTSERTEAAPTVESSPATDAFAGCTGCHRDLDKVFTSGKVTNLLYSHKVHFAKGVSDCAMCHPANAHEPEVINKPTMQRCFMCHGLAKTAMASGKCETCHPRDMRMTPRTHDVRWFRTHGKAARKNPLECGMCHQQRTCASCHGLPMPHPQGWQSAPHVTAFFQSEGRTCARCHARGPALEGRDFCDRCHHPAGDKTKPWIRVHRQVVKAEGTGKCVQCHQPSTCAGCHTTGREDFTADRRGGA
ncbi:MAG: hypothetical protein HY775_04985 [Acidobacteria bacterium]|nr:hypothetical protein [Acidobacteriota bacterium]